MTGPRMLAGAAGGSDGDKEEGAGRGASLHANQHGQSGLDILEPRTLEGGRRAIVTGSIVLLPSTLSALVHQSIDPSWHCCIFLVHPLHSS